MTADHRLIAVSGDEQEKEQQDRQEWKSGSDFASSKPLLCLFCLLHPCIRILQPAHGEPDACHQNDQTQQKAAEVADEVADKFPLTAEPVAQSTVQDDPGRFTGDIIFYELGEFVAAASGDQVGGDG